MSDYLGHWYDRQGNRITMLEWGRLYEQEDYVRVGLTEIGPYVVSTVWLGLDNNFVDDGHPILFETLVFTKSAWEADRTEEDHELLLEIDGQRYHTEQEAMRGHEDICTLVRATYVEDPDLGHETQPERNQDDNHS